ncbi:MAG: hypothetical protein RLY31_2306 [Bacteroidota bacterium]|jgi:ABC-2 type transport system ATP-binding protein
MSLLHLDNIVKRYDAHLAVDHVSFDIPKGVIFGMLGPNGAGKTSLIRIITTITKADAGTIRFDGEPLDSRHPEQIGYMPEERGLYKKMKVGEQLRYLARLKGLSAETTRKELRYWFDRFAIRDWSGKKIEELSKGMQQKIQFIATVIHRPKLLILDEPFSGLDPINARLIQDEIMQLNREGTTIIFSTHRMEQVEEMCEQIVLINKGRNILYGKVADIRQQFKENLFRISFAEALPAEWPLEPFPLPGVTVRAKDGPTLLVQVDPARDTNGLLQHFINSGRTIRSFQEILPAINDIFIRQVTGEAQPVSNPNQPSISA